MNAVKTTLDINGEPTEVTLTRDQVKDILRKSQDVKDRITSIEAAYEDCGHDINQMRPFANPVNAHQKYLNACSDEKVLAEALNEGKDPADQEYGYIPVFRSHKHESGFGFSRVAGGWTASHSTVGSHRAFVTEELAEFAAINFREMYSTIHKK